MTAGFVIAVTAVVVVGLACGAWRAVSTGEPAAGEGHWREVRSRPGARGTARAGAGAPSGLPPAGGPRPIQSPGYPSGSVPALVVQERADHE